MRNEIGVRVIASLIVALVALSSPLLEGRRAQSLPQRLTDAEFRSLVTDASEPDGYFVLADNYSSNEIEVGALVTRLADLKPAGNAYIGVGPEQNFSYIAALRPESRLCATFAIRPRFSTCGSKPRSSWPRIAPTFCRSCSVGLAPPASATRHPLNGSSNCSKPHRSNRPWPIAASRASRNRLTKTHGFTLTPQEAAALGTSKTRSSASGRRSRRAGTTDQGRLGMTAWASPT